MSIQELSVFSSELKVVLGHHAPLRIFDATGGDSWDILRASWVTGWTHGPIIHLAVEDPLSQDDTGLCFNTDISEQPYLRHVQDADQFCEHWTAQTPLWRWIHNTLMPERTLKSALPLLNYLFIGDGLMSWQAAFRDRPQLIITEECGPDVEGFIASMQQRHDLHIVNVQPRPCAVEDLPPHGLLIRSSDAVTYRNGAGTVVELLALN